MPKTMLSGLRVSISATLLFLFIALPLSGAETVWSIEFKGRYRDSDLAEFLVNYPFGPQQIPAGDTGVFLRTVEPGEHFELSSFTLELERSWGRGAFFVKLDAVDLDDRNPTSEADEFDVDELWLRLGSETEPAVLPEGPSAYIKFGKFPHFERQDDRHLESYGIVSTAFNRLEDVGVEGGLDLGRYAYLKASYTQGNPIFMRGTNALAGDNGTPVFLEPNPRLDLNSGIVIPYDADLQDLDFENPEAAVALGLRVSDATGVRGAEVMLWSTERNMAETVDIDGSFYGGDLDLLLGPNNSAPFPVTSNRKEETGANLWLYLGNFSLFAQTVDQDLAGLDRSGLEVELAWRWDLPIFWSIGENQILRSIAPALRYSELDPKFSGPQETPTPSFTWDWEKIDYGLRIGLVGRSDLTLEYSDNTFTLANGRDVGNDELLATLRLRFGS